MSDPGAPLGARIAAQEHEWRLAREREARAGRPSPSSPALTGEQLELLEAARRKDEETRRVRTKALVQRLVAIEDPIERMLRTLGKCVAIKDRALVLGDRHDHHVPHRIDVVRRDVLDQVLPGLVGGGHRAEPNYHAVKNGVDDVAVARWFAERAKTDSIPPETIRWPMPERRRISGRLRFDYGGDLVIQEGPAERGWSLPDGAHTDCYRDVSVGAATEKRLVQGVHDVLVRADGELFPGRWQAPSRNKDPQPDGRLNVVALVRMAKLLQFLNGVSPDRASTGMV
jgi:hypothetical protein